jgi:polyisoprenoid-binding protein YceI
MPGRGNSGNGVAVAAGGRSGPDERTLARASFTSRDGCRGSCRWWQRFLGHDHEIDAPVTEGRVELRGGDPSRSSVRLRFETRRLAVVAGTEPAGDVPQVEARMRGPDVLDVDRHPLVVFSSASVTGSTLEPGRYRLLVRGALQVKGRSVPVAIPLDARLDGEVLEAEGEVELRLRDLGIEPPTVAGVVKVADRFRLAFTIVARPPG